MEDNSLKEAMRQSEEEFRAQFDRSSPSFHGGIDQPVPIGGERIPASMSSMYPEGYDPSQASACAPLTFGPEYQQEESTRAIYLGLKKSINRLSTIVEALARHEVSYREHADPNNPSHVKTYQDNVLHEQASLAQCRSELQCSIAVLETQPGEALDLAKDLKDLLHSAEVRRVSKEEVGEFNFQCKRASTKAFAASQRSLQKMKELKKAAQAPPSEAK